MGVNEKARELLSEVKASREFSDLKQAKVNIEKDKNLKSMVEDFHKREMALFSGRLSAKEAETRTAELNEKFKTISQIPAIDNYLKASKRFNDMITSMYKIIADAVDSEIRIK